MIPYFVTCHVNSHTVLNYIDAVQSLGLPGDPCPMCQAESGLFVLDDVPDSAPIIVTCNEACDASVSTHTLQDWFANKPLFALPLPMQFDDPLVKKYCMNEIEELWKFIEEQTGVPFNWESMKKRLELQNQLQRDEWEKWEVDAKTPYYPINGVAQALFRIYSTQYGIQGDFWHEASEKVKKIMYKCVEKKINTFPKTRHRVIAWSCAPLYFSNWCTWAYNCWGLNVVINMDSLMFDMEIRTDSYENMLEDMATYHMWTWPPTTCGLRCAAWLSAACTTSSSSGSTWSASTAIWSPCMTSCSARACRVCTVCSRTSSARETSRRSGCRMRCLTAVPFPVPKSAVRSTTT